MVASFPEFDYTKNRSNKGGCVPSAQKPSRLRSTLHSKPSAHSTLIGKILSFHGSFNYSNGNTQKGTQISGLSDAASKLKGTSASSANVAGPHVGTPPSDPVKRNAAPKNGTSASKMGRKWSSYKSVSSHLSVSGSQENQSGVTQVGDLFQAGGDPPGKQSATEMGNLASSNAVCNVREQANVAQSKENLHTISSSAPGASNFSGENPLYASDNSSNNVRWSSTSCASTDTSSSNSTRHTSCESRIFTPSPAPPAFLAKPHKAHDAAWVAIRSLQLRQGGAPLAVTHFNLIRRVGHGDIGSVFLAHLKDKLVASPSDTSCLFAIKVMDKEALLQRNKLQRMHMEKEILECVDHPFLPTLYAHFDSEHYSCLVMDFCPGGDLYALRQKQPGKRFGLIAARFYAAEVLLALEYLHMLGIVYRDLKPENVLVREDGHIMLTDFDLSLKCDVKPELVKHLSLSSASLSNSSSKRRLLRSYSQSSTISSSSTTSFLHHESSNCRLPAACSIDPILSCLTLANNAGKRAPHIPKQQSPIGFSLLSSKVSKASHAHTSGRKDGSVSEPLKVAKQHVLCTESTPSTSNAVDGGREAAKGIKISTMHLRSNASQAHPNVQLLKESHDSPSAGHSRAQKSHGAERAMTSGLGCLEEDDLMFMELVAEPMQARSMSFVGTHEYLAPEIIAGHGHGSPVDWWTFGIFLYELLYGKSPFKGASNDQTLINIIRQNLRFPDTGAEVEGIEDAKSLIQGLLMKDPRGRLGCTKGAAEIKQHAFFKGVNWALIRCTQPPEVPSPGKKGMHASSNHHHHQNIYHHHHHSKSLHQFDYF